MPRPAGSTHGCLARSPHPVSAGRRRSSRRGASRSCFLTSPCTSSVVKRSWAPILPPLHRFTPLHGLQEEEFLCWKPWRNGGPRSLRFHPIACTEECCSMSVADITGGPAALLFPLCFSCFSSSPRCALMASTLFRFGPFLPSWPACPDVPPTWCLRSHGPGGGAKRGGGRGMRLKNCPRDPRPAAPNLTGHVCDPWPCFLGFKEPGPLRLAGSSGVSQEAGCCVVAVMCEMQYLFVGCNFETQGTPYSQLGKYNC